MLQNFGGNIKDIVIGIVLIGLKRGQDCDNTWNVCGSSCYSSSYYTYLIYKERLYDNAGNLGPELTVYFHFGQEESIMKKKFIYFIMIVGVLCIVVAIALSVFGVFSEKEEITPKLTTTEMVNQAIEILADRSDYTEDDLIFSEINDDGDVVFNVSSEDGLSLVVDLESEDYYFVSVKTFGSTTDVLTEK